MGKLKHKEAKVNHTSVTGVTFSTFTCEEIEKLSVVKITTPLSFNALGHNLEHGLYDPALGPLGEKGDPCTTCSKGMFNCGGHMGFIELPLPVINPLFNKMVLNILKLACLQCHTLQIKDFTKHLYILKLKLMAEGFVTEAQEANLVIEDFSKLNYESVSEEIITSSIEEKLSKLNYESVSEEIITSLIEEKLSGYMEMVMKGRSSDQRPEMKTKFVESSVNELINALDKNVLREEKCQNCKEELTKVTSVKRKLMVSVNKTSAMSSPDSGISHCKADKKDMVLTVILPDEARDHLRKIWTNEKKFLLALVPVLRSQNIEYPTDIFFISMLCVPPSKMRPVNYVSSKLIEHPQTQTFKTIVQNSIIVRSILKAVQDGDLSGMSEEGKEIVQEIPGSCLREKLNVAWNELQSNIDFLMDSNLNKSKVKTTGTGIKQLIEKKEGILRMHMMGKRVNYAARSVITPDPYLNIDEIGIPETFAKFLTYPVNVTSRNADDLREMILNGPDVYPGAIMIESVDGSTTKLVAGDLAQRESVAKCIMIPNEKKKSLKMVKTVHRHLCNGDLLLLNRQPTLHRPSIMAHIVRILKGEKTLRLHYANCKAYNADFDGDEMNAHLPQNELARSEAFNLLNVRYQYLVPKDGTPLSGLIQDHIISAVQLSVRGRFFNGGDYQQLVFEALGHLPRKIKLLPPAIMKPRKLWSGKQIISTLLINIVPNGLKPLNISSTTKVGDAAWTTEKPRAWKAGGTPFTDHMMSETEVLIREGELLCGVLDKTHHGATPYGLIHSMNELYGGTCSSKLLSSLAKLYNGFLQRSGFTLGVEDILLVGNNEEQRTEIVMESRNVGKKAACSAVNLPETATSSELKEKMEELYNETEKGRIIIDRSYKDELDGFTNEINKACIPKGLLKHFPHNSLQLMILSGAKGSTVNAMQISCLLGQIELEGKRPPPMKSGKTLPSFAQYDTSPRAGGFVDGRFMTGIKPQEFYYHCMAGREGLIDTAVKTSRSGYLQRCLIKHLEGLVVSYDMTVRDSDGSVVQFCYGEDGRDVMKAQFLKKEHIPFLADNCEAMKLIPLKKLEDIETSAHIARHMKEIMIWKEKNGSPLQKSRQSPFTVFTTDMKKEVSPKQKQKQIDKDTGRSYYSQKMCKLWRNADSGTREKYRKLSKKCADPVISSYQSDRDYGAVTEQLEQLMCQYLKERPSAKKDEFNSTIFVKSIQSQAHAGEPVGLLAAQSVGEPSTQMTLNTFHFAGRGEMNVTLGIPRLRELLMTASKNIKTPNMDIPFKPSQQKIETAQQLKLKLCRTTVIDVLHSITVTDYVEFQSSRQNMYNIRFHFLPKEAYDHKFCVNPSYVLHYIEKKFLNSIIDAMGKAVKFKTSNIDSKKLSMEKMNDDEDLDGEQGSSDQSDQALFEEAKKAGVGEGHESSDEEMEDNDDDATKSRRRERHTENQEYQEPEEEENMQESEDEGIEVDKNSEDTDEGNGFTTESLPTQLLSSGSLVSPQSTDSSESPEFETQDESYKNTLIVENVKYETRRRNVITSTTYIADYDYDTEEELWCQVVLSIPLTYKRLDLTSLLQDVASSSVIWDVPLIKKAITYTNTDNGLLTLKTDGVNFQEMFKLHRVLNLNKLYSNDVHQMAETFGIEAARRVIVKEIQNVFKVYGIVIDPRHLLLVADYMTVSGKYEPFSRRGFEHSTSPLQQMSFESSVNFLRDAVIRGKRDDLHSPSSRLMVGEPFVGGTGVFSLLQRIPPEMEENEMEYFHNEAK